MPIQVICPNCHSNIPKDSAFCMVCGMDAPPSRPRLPSTRVKLRTCPNCCSREPEDAAFCTNCGFDLPPRPHQRKAVCTDCGQSYAASAHDNDSTCPDCRKLKEKEKDKRKSDSGMLKPGMLPRMTERLQARDCYVRITRSAGGVLETLFGGKQSDLAPVVDLSLGGMQCYTNIEVQRSDNLQVEIRLPGNPDPLFLKAAVSWVVREGSSRYRLGLQFLALDWEFRERLLAYLRNLSMRALSDMEQPPE